MANNLNIRDTLSVAGVAIGNASLSNLSSTAVNVNLNPGADDTVDLGETGLSWRNLYVNSAIKDSANVVILDVTNRTLQDSTGALSVDFEDRTLNDVSGNVQLTYSDAGVVYSNQDFQPSLDTTFQLGGSSNRWTVIYGVTVNASSSVITPTLSLIDGSNAISIAAPIGLAANYSLTLPGDDGTSGQVLTTNGSGVLSWTTAVDTGITQLTGDVTAGPGNGSQASTIANDAVTNAKLANMAFQTIKGRITGSTGDPEDLTPSQATLIINTMVGDSGSGGTKGLVPAPGAGDAAALKYLKADGSWDVPAGSGTGDVVGPASATDNSLTRFDGTTGKLIQDSNATLSDLGELTLSALRNNTNFSAINATATLNTSGASGTTITYGGLFASVVPSGSPANSTSIGLSVSASRASSLGGLRGVDVAVTNSGSSGGTGYGVRVIPSNSGTIANYYGLYTSEMPATVSGDNYALYVASGNSYFGGNLQLTTAKYIEFQDTTGGEYVRIGAPGTISASYALTWPTAQSSGIGFLRNNGSGVLTWVAAATTTLSNLTSTEINQSLLPDADITYDLGSTALRWTNLYALNIRGNTTSNAIVVQSRQLANASGVVTVAWSSGQFTDASSVNAGNWFTRILQNASGTTVVDWSGTGAAIRGTTTNDSASAGFVGEVVESIVSSNTNYPATTVYGDLTSISLTAGDWDVSIAFFHDPNGATLTSTLYGLSTTSGNSATGLSNPGTQGTAGFVYQMTSSLPNMRVSLSATTTHYLKYQAVYSAGTPQARGRLFARRVR